MAEEKIRITIDGNSKGAITAIQQTQGAFSNLMKVFGVGMLAGGGIAIAQKGFQMLETSIRGAINFLQSSIKEAGNAERQLTKLNTALQSTGHYTEAGSQELQDYAESLQAVTRFEDDTIIGVEAMLATFKLSNDEIKIATQATLDLAAAMDTDLQSAAILLGKAMVGETGMLKRYGIIVDENRYAAEGWRAVIEEINKEFGGQAQAQAKDYLGLQDRLKNSFSNLKEVVGNAFLPTFSKLVTKFLEGTPIVDKFGNVLADTKSPFEKIQEFVEKAAEKIKEFLDVAMAADYGEVTEGLEDIAQVIGWLGGDEGFKNMAEAYQVFVDRLGDSLTVLSRVAAFFKAAIDFMALSWKSFVLSQSIGTENWGKAWKDWEETFAGIGEGIKVTLEGIEEKEKLVLGSTDGLSSSIVAATQPTDDFAGAIGGVNSALGTQYSELDKSVKFLEGRYIDVMEGVEEVIHGVTTEEEIMTGVLMEQMTPGFVIAAGKASSFAGGMDKVSASLDASIGKAQGLKSAIDALEDKKITITTVYETIGSAAHPGFFQSGGTIRRDQYITDLGIRAVKGEGIIPAPLMKAIKEGWGSFAGVGTGSKSKGDIYVQIYGDQFFSSNMDTENWTTEVANQIKRKSAGVGS